MFIFREFIEYVIKKKEELLPERVDIIQRSLENLIYLTNR